MSQFHLGEDACSVKYWMRIRSEVYMSADHGMNFKSRCYDLNTAVPRKGAEIFAMSAERPVPQASPHVWRHCVRLAWQPVTSSASPTSAAG
jgi:hypothetical protein